MKALIVGDSCGALATVRELGRAGWTVGIGSSSRFGWAAMSRYATHWHHVSWSYIVGQFGSQVKVYSVV